MTLKPADQPPILRAMPDWSDRADPAIAGVSPADHGNPRVARWAIVALIATGAVALIAELFV